ncbi:expressed unknown protein [Seminavis robusta]|uniref:Uncharacterized protein n=1 Tax=Seminavis robusta TaxID=568900 RepID=A0A9N8HFJ1_9STRA|nr:expressed unknown protein [Seminavis robusta]|eukprot:Sro574_g169140.1 n/a (221) ;mRNA; f:13477-14250
MIEGHPSRTALFIAAGVPILGTTGCDLLPEGILPFQKAVLSALQLTWVERIFLFVLCDNPVFCRLFACVGASSRQDTTLFPFVFPPKFPETCFWEVDHPATGHCKDRLWSKDKNSQGTTTTALLKKPPNLFHAHVDLVEKDVLVTSLREKASYDTVTPTIVVMEGLLSFLDTDQIKNLFENVAQVVGGPDSRVVFNMPAVQVWQVLGLWLDIPPGSLFGP